ncbi:MAG: hypothetical protein ABIG93_00715 [archaeon]|nr:hypothetical protein [Nanoarchaeota archaeon]
MLDRKAIDWIKSEEAKGLSDVKVKKELEKGGWKDEDIAHAINLAHKGKINWMPILGVFLVSLIAFAFFTGIIFSLGILIFCLLYTLIPYIKSGKKELYSELFLLIFSSALISSAIALATFNLSVLIIHLVDIIIPIWLIIVLPIISVIILFYAFFLILAKLSKHFIGYFDYESFFVFKHWPFKLFNINWKHKWAVVKYPLIAAIVPLIIFLLVFNFYFIPEFNEKLERSSEGVNEQVSQQLLDNLIEQISRVPISEHLIYPIHKIGNNLEYDPDCCQDFYAIYRNCDVEELRCKELIPVGYTELEELFLEFPDGISIIDKYELDNSTYLLFRGTHSYEELLSGSLFDEDMLHLEIIQELEDNFDSYYLEKLESDPVEANIFNFFSVVNNRITSTMELARFSANNFFSRDVANYEWDEILEGYEQGVFYDGTDSLTEHVTRLTGNVKLLYDRYLETEELDVSEEFYYSSGGFMGIVREHYNYKYLRESVSSWEYLARRTSLVQDFSQQLGEEFNKYPRDTIEEYYEDRYVEESEESKAIRLKLLETYLARELQNACYDYQAADWNDYEDYITKCTIELADITQKPELYMDYEDMEKYGVSKY